MKWAGLVVSLIVTLVVAGACLVLGPATVLLDYNLARSGQVVQAEVLDVESGRSKKLRTAYYIARVRYAAGNKLVEKQIANGSAEPAATISVRYAPLWPSWAVTGSEYPEPHTPSVISKLLLCALFGFGALAGLRQTLQALGSALRRPDPHEPAQL